MNATELGVLAVILAAGCAAGAWVLRPRHGRHELAQRAAEPELPDLCSGCFDDSEHCDGMADGCCCTCGFGEDWAEEHGMPLLPPERSREELGFTGELRGLPAPGKDMYSDRNVWLPRTPPAAGLDERKARFLAAVERHDPPQALPAWQPPAYGLAAVDRTHAERMATDTDVRTTRPAHRCATCDACGDKQHAQGELPDWVIKALGDHDGPDASVESIVARAVTP